MYSKSYEVLKSRAAFRPLSVLTKLMSSTPIDSVLSQHLSCLQNLKRQVLLSPGPMQPYAWTWYPCSYSRGFPVGKPPWCALRTDSLGIHYISYVHPQHPLLCGPVFFSFKQLRGHSSDFSGSKHEFWPESTKAWRMLALTQVRGSSTLSRFDHAFFNSSH